MKILLLIAVCFNLLGPQQLLAKKTELAKFLDAIYSSGNTHYNNQQYLLAASQFSLLMKIKDQSLLKDKAMFAYTLSVWRLGDTIELDRQLTQLNEIRNAKISEQASLFKSFLNPEKTYPLSKVGRSRLLLWKSRNTPSIFNKYLTKTDLKLNAKLSDIPTQYTDLPTKSPLLAGTLSLVPGLGQFYNDAYESAAIAFVLNLIFGFATYELIQNALPAAGAASGLVFSVTYFGNIVSAYQGAQQYNKSRRYRIDEKLSQELFHFYPYP